MAHPEMITSAARAARELHENAPAKLYICGLHVGPRPVLA